MTRPEREDAIAWFKAEREEYIFRLKRWETGTFRVSEMDLSGVWEDTTARMANHLRAIIAEFDRLIAAYEKLRD